MNLFLKYKSLLITPLFCLFFSHTNAWADTTRCYKVQTSSFLTIEAAQKHLLNLEKVLENLLPFDSVENITIEKYNPYYTTRVGCLKDKETMEQYLAILRLYWFDAKPVVLTTAPDASILVKLIQVKGQSSAQEQDGESIVNNSGITSTDRPLISSDDAPVLLAKPINDTPVCTPEPHELQTREPLISKAATKEFPPVIVMTIPIETDSSPNLSSNKIVQKADFLLLYIIAILTFCCLFITIKLRRTF